MAKRNTSKSRVVRLEQPSQAGAAGAGYSPFIRVSGDVVYLAVKLQPRAARNEICQPAGEELRIRVTAPPVDSAANDALLRLLADRLDCPRNAVQIVRGHTSRHKTVAVSGLSSAVIMERLFSQP